MPVASRTRSKREAPLIQQYHESKKRSKLQLEDENEGNPKIIMSIPKSSSKGRSYDDDDYSMEGSDEVLTSTSGEDNDESEDLDYYYEEEEKEEGEEDPQCSSSTDGEVQAMVSETPSHTKERIRETEFVSEHPGRIRRRGFRDSKPCQRKDYRYEEEEEEEEEDEEEEDPQCSSSSDGEVQAMVLEKPSHTKGRIREIEFVSEHPGRIRRRGFRDSKPCQRMDYHYEEEEEDDDDDDEEEDPQCSSSSDGEVKAMVLETPRRAKGRIREIKFISEHPGDGRKDSNVLDICVDKDVIELSTSITKSRKKGRPAGSSKQPHLLRVLSDFLLDKEDIDSSTPGQVLEGVMDHSSLPLKFTFGVQDTIIPDEKTEFDQELESLWTEMQFCLASSEIGSKEPSLVENEDADISEVEHDKAILCRQGKHQLMLDEETGMKCKFCSFVQLEIKYITPPLMRHPCGKFERQYHGILDSSLFDDLQFQDPYNDMPGCDPSAAIKGTVWESIPNIKSRLYPHQREGFEFIWNNIAGGIYRDKSRNSSNGGCGCIISHAPGTGKTLLTIVFLQTYLKEYPSCRPVIVAPCSLLLTWEAEFKKWNVDIPFHNLNSHDFSGKEKRKEVDLYRKFKNGVPYPGRPLAQRLVKLLSWKSDGGVLGISYRLFEQLAGIENKGKQKCSTVDKHVSKILLEFPGLFVLDEGHTPRNDGTLMWKALSRIKTERRIILSGTPFQNNFDELFNTLCLVRPKFAEGIQCRHREKVDKKHGCETDDGKSKWAILTGSIGKDVDRYEAEKLREIRTVIKPFVHVHKGTILQTTLPGLRHSVVVLRPSDLQKKILEHVKETKNAFSLDYCLSLISVHPSLLQQLSDHKDIKESVSSIVSIDELERIRLKPHKGVKTKFLIELLKLSGALDEKVIVFSQYLEPLNLIIDQLKDFFKWNEGVEIFYMHGKCDVKQRQCVIDTFNDPRSKARVLLASTKAFSEGINLVGGSRVVLLDVTWNPSVERQAICRAYRLGQKKVVYTYHLISSGTMEGSKCYRQAGKDRLSELVFSSSDKGEDHQKRICNVVEDKILEEMFQHEKLKSMFEKIINHPKDSDLIVTFEGL
ncbi:hypothetical protein DITRI_Ditri14bG0123800 [Diplodiscus trichospermus]